MQRTFPGYSPSQRAGSGWWDGGFDRGTFCTTLEPDEPQFFGELDGVDQCFPYWGMDFDDAAVSEGAPEAGGGGSVEVLQVKEVGPYTASVVKSDGPDALSAWLAENDYEQPLRRCPSSLTMSHKTMYFSL